MKRAIVFALAFMFVHTFYLMAQRPTGQVVSGATSSGTPAAILTDSNGVVSVQGLSTGSGVPVYVQACSGATCYTSPVNYGATVIASGSTSTITSVTTSMDAGSFCNNGNSAAVTLTITDGNNVYIHGPAFSIPALSYLSFNDIAGSIFTSGIKMSASVASAITCWVRGHQ